MNLLELKSALDEVIIGFESMLNHGQPEKALMHLLRGESEFADKHSFSLHIRCPELLMVLGYDPDTIRAADWHMGAFEPFDRHKDESSFLEALRHDRSDPFSFSSYDAGGIPCMIWLDGLSEEEIRNKTYPYRLSQHTVEDIREELDSSVSDMRFAHAFLFEIHSLMMLGEHEQVVTLCRSVWPIYRALWMSGLPFFESWAEVDETFMTIELIAEWCEAVIAKSGDSEINWRLVEKWTSMLLATGESSYKTRLLEFGFLPSLAFRMSYEMGEMENDMAVSYCERFPCYAVEFFPFRKLIMRNDICVKPIDTSRFLPRQRVAEILKRHSDESEKQRQSWAQRRPVFSEPVLFQRAPVPKYSKKDLQAMKKLMTERRWLELIKDYGGKIKW